MKTTQELEQQIRRSPAPVILRDPAFGGADLTAYLRGLLEARGRSVQDIILRCNLDRSYGYQLFNGTRTPTRDFLLLLSVVLQLPEEEAQRLLKLAGRPALYPRNRRDAAVLYALSHRLSLDEANALLTDLGEEKLL